MKYTDNQIINFIIPGVGNDVTITAYGRYIFYETETNSVTAEKICQLNGGHLLALETIQEFEALKPTYTVSTYYLIGANDRQTEGILILLACFYYFPSSVGASMGDARIFSCSLNFAISIHG